VVFRDLRRLLADERPRLGWWVVLVGLSTAFALLELVGSLAVLTLMRLFLETEPGAAVTIARLELPIPADWPIERLRIVLAAGLVTLFAMRAALMVAVSYLGARLSTMASVRIARRLLDGYLHLPYDLHTQRRSSDMVRDTFVSTERLHEKATLPLTALATDAIVTAGLVGALLVVDPVVTLLAAVLLASATLVVQRVVRPRLRRWSVRAQTATSASLESLQQALNGLRDIRLLGQESRFLMQHDRERRRLARYRYLTAAAQSLPRSLIELATITTLVLIFLLARTSDSATTDVLPLLAMFAYVGLRLQPVLNRVVRHINEIRSSQGLISDLLSELASVHTVVHRAAPEPDGGPPDDAIQFHSVSYAYPADGDAGVREPVLHDVDLEIPAGSFVGIVGPTGSGKSTLLDLIVGLLTPTSGTITVGGRELGEAPTWWWRRLGVVSQAIYLAPTTIRENVAFGAADPMDASVEQRIWESLAIAHLADDVRRLPDGLDTTIGDDGARLSGGQRQRLALARAVFRDPPVIVFDEATSALDHTTEAAVMAMFRPDAMSANARPRTLIVVTHRPTTVAAADRVYRVAAGRVVPATT